MRQRTYISEMKKRTTNKSEFNSKISPKQTDQFFQGEEERQSGKERGKKERERWKERDRGVEKRGESERD